MDNFIEILEYIKSGTIIATSSARPQMQGSMSVLMMPRAAMGVELSKIVDTGIAYIDENNIDHWIELVSGNLRSVRLRRRNAAMLEARRLTKDTPASRHSNWWVFPLKRGRFTVSQEKTVMFNRIAYVPREIDLFGDMAVAENLFLPFENHGIRGTVRQKTLNTQGGSAARSLRYWCSAGFTGGQEPRIGPAAAAVRQGNYSRELPPAGAQ